MERRKALKFSLKKFSVALVLLFSLTGCGDELEPASGVQLKADGFEIICQSFDALVEQSHKNDWNSAQRYDFIKNQVDKNLQKDEPALAAWEAISSAVPDVRYELFITAAQSTGKDEWSCPPMESAIKSLGS